MSIPFPSSVRSNAALALFLVGLTCSSIASAAEDQFHLNMEQVELSVFVDQVADITGKTFLLGSNVHGTVNIIGAAPLTRSQVWDVFEQVLKAHDQVLIEQNDVIQIRPSSEAVRTPTDSSGSDGMVTQVIHLKGMDAGEVMNIVKPMASGYGHIAIVPSSNSLLIVDRRRTVSRINDLIVSLDESPPSRHMHVIDVEYGSVENISELLTALLPEALEQRETGRLPASIVADATSNRLIIRGTQETIDIVAAVVAELDTESNAQDKAVVIRLQNSDAAEMQTILVGIMESEELVHRANIIADERRNALVVRAKPRALEEIRSIIDELDQPQAQVLIEAAIVEVAGSLGEQFGIQSAVAGENGVPAVGTNFSNSGPSASTLTGKYASEGVPGAVSSLGNGLLGAIGGNFDDAYFGAIVQALESQSNTNLLSTPHVMTVDNVESRLLVGENVPFQVSQGTGDDGESRIERQDVATELVVRPNIQANDVVRLTIKQTVEELIGGNGADLVGRTSKREVETQVLVPHGETIVLGGMAKDRVIESEQRVPLLSSLPIVGNLFRSTSQTQEKVNLLVIIRPTIVTDNLTEYAEGRYQDIWELRIGHDGDVLRVEAPSLDDLFRGQAESLGLGEQ